VRVTLNQPEGRLKAVTFRLISERNGGGVPGVKGQRRSRRGGHKNGNEVERCSALEALSPRGSFAFAKNHQTGAGYHRPSRYRILGPIGTWLVERR
jgi:hypothetical protein